MFTTRRKLTGWPLGLLAACALFLIYSLQHLLVPFALAGGLAYVVSPLLNGVHRRWGWPRPAAAVAMYLLIITVIAAVGWSPGAQLYHRAPHLLADDPAHWDKVAARFLGAERVTLLGTTITAHDVATRARAALDKFMAADGAAQIGRMAIGAVFGVILFLVLLFYFLIEGPRLAAGTLALAPPEHRPGLQSFAVQAHPILFRYITGLVVIVLFTALVVWVGVGPVFHLPHPWLLAITTGVLELLPVAGPTISACLLGGTAVNHGGTVWTFAGFAVFCFAVRIGVDQVVGPIVLGRAVRLSPIVVIFAFLAGGMLFGMLGVILAIPAMAMIKLALENYYALPVE